MMYRPRIRFTVRWLMVAVAVAALILGGLIGYHRRRERFRDLASCHAGFYLLYAEIAIDVKPPQLRGEPMSPERARWDALSTYHGELHDKYIRAAERPWLSVPPDPPPPVPEPDDPGLPFYRDLKRRMSGR